MTEQLARHYREHVDQLALSMKQAHARHGHEEFAEAYAAFLFEVQEHGNRELWRRLITANDVTSSEWVDLPDETKADLIDDVMRTPAPWGKH